MGTGRIEAFSDGVIAIIVTIMVLELRPPAATSLAALIQLKPIFLSYLLSFIVVAIMWVNHHHLMHALREVNARVLWLNINLLFWMSLIPFVTVWLGQNPSLAIPVSVYGADLALCAAGFWLLRTELARQALDSPELLALHTRLQRKTALAISAYLAASAAAFWSTTAAETIFAVIPILYFVPEKQVREPQA